MSAAIPGRDSFASQRDATSDAEVRPSMAGITTERWSATGTYADHVIRGLARQQPSCPKRLDVRLSHSIYDAAIHRPNPAEALRARHGVLPVRR